MDSITIPLALGCVLNFSHPHHEMTRNFGEPTDGTFYQEVSVIDARGRKKLLEPIRARRAYSPGEMFKVGRSPDGQYASYLVLRQGATRNEEDVRFVSAHTCNAVRFVRVRDGAEIDAASHRGWDERSAHGVRLWRDGQADEVALPQQDAATLNPSIDKAR
jgi:hypothetical protein